MAGTEIRSITARQVYTNRGNPGVEAVVTTENGATGRAMCTSGISIGTHEIHFDFDGGERFRGKGVLGAVRNVNEIIAPALKGLDAANQRLIDRTMLDIVPDAKAKLGGNATAAVSAAVLKAGAAALGIPLYRHIGGANAMYLPVPGVAMVAGHERYGGGITTPGGKPTMSVMCFGFDTFADASYACWDIHTRWAEKMDRRFGGAPNIRDFIVVPEGVFKSDEEIWEAMTETIIEAGYEGKAGFQMDVATDTYFAVSAINQSTEKLESADGAQRLIAYNEYEKPDAVFPEELPDAYFSVILSSMEAAYSAELSFENVEELTEAELYTSFQLFSSEDDLLNCWNEAAQAYCYTKDMICSTLDRYYNGYTYRIEEDPFYDPSYDAIVTTVVGGFGGGLYVDDLKIQSDGSKCIIEGTVRDGNGEEIARKEYTFEFYNGGFYICSIRVCAK